MEMILDLIFAFISFFFPKKEKEVEFINKYSFGSRVYGTNRENSDYDYVYILPWEIYEEPKNTDHKHYTIRNFQLLIDEMDICALECYFLPENSGQIENHKFTFNLDKQKLRTQISKAANNSWVKGKKRLTITADYDKMIAIKSIFHSIRILDFGIQIATEGRIYNYSNMNYLWNDIYAISEPYSQEPLVSQEKIEGKFLWDILNDRYKKLFNEKASAFKKACPHKSIKEDRRNIINILEKHKVEPKVSLVDELVGAIK